MLKTIVGVIVGFIAMFILVIVSFAIPMAVMGLENITKPGTYWTTDTFNIIVLVGGFIAAVVGGLVCALIARNATAGFALVAILIAFGIGGAVMNMNKPDPPARTGPVTIDDYGTHGKEPTWFAFSKVAVGAVGVLIGASMVKRRNAGAA